MEITAAIEALRRLPSGVEVTIRTDSQYLVNTMTLGWKRRENLDLWKILDAELAQRKVTWEWVRGHSGNTFNERADELARNAALGKPQSPSLDNRAQASLTTAGGLHIHSQAAEKKGTSTKQRLEPQSSVLSSGETAEAEMEARSRLCGCCGHCLLRMKVCVDALVAIAHLSRSVILHECEPIARWLRAN